jgi:hypothetical protein
MRLHTLLLSLSLLPATLLAQSDAGQKEAMDLLTGGSTRQWTQIGTVAGTVATCAPGDRYYQFQQKPAQVVVQNCVDGKLKPSTLPLTTWTANGKSGVAFGGTRYEVKTLNAGAPVCKGNANCLRLASVPDGSTDASTTIYLTR